MSKIEASKRSLIIMLLNKSTIHCIITRQSPLQCRRSRPFICQRSWSPSTVPDPVVQKESLGEVLSGDCLTSALYKLNFWKNKVAETLCHKKLEGDDVAKFRDAVINDFYFQMYYDGLPFWGFVGKIGYNACMCYAFFLMLGTVGFQSSLMFVRYIYRAVKSE